MKTNKGLLVLIALLAIPAIWIILWKQTQFGYTKLPIYSTVEFGDTIPYSIDTFSLYDQTGRPFTRESIGDRVMVASFFFASCPDICPKINSHLKELTNSMHNNSAVVFVSHSVDPENDTIAALQQYATDLEIDPEQWHLLTGPRRTIYNLATESYRVVNVQKDSNAFIHSEKLILVDKDLRIRGYYDGLDYMAVTKTLKEDIRFLLKEYKDAEQ